MSRKKRDWILERSTSVGIHNKHWTGDTIDLSGHPLFHEHIISTDFQRVERLSEPVSLFYHIKTLRVFTLRRSSCAPLLLSFLLSLPLSLSFSSPLCQSQSRAQISCFRCNFRRFQFEEIGYNNRAGSALHEFALSPVSLCECLCVCEYVFESVLVSAHSHTHTCTHYCVGKQNNENETLGQCLVRFSKFLGVRAARHGGLPLLSEA